MGERRVSSVRFPQDANYFRQVDFSSVESDRGRDFAERTHS